MGFLKKNLTFTVVVTVCLLVFAAGAYLAFAEFGKIDQAQQKIASAKSTLNNLLTEDPAPTEENLEASQKNVAQLEAELANIRENLELGSRLTTSTDGIRVMAAIQQYISEYRRRAGAPEESEAKPIQLPANFAFGFEQYLDEAQMLDDQELIPVFDKQRQILSYLLNKLYDADPESIVSVKREVLELKNDAKNSDKNFRIKPAVSARVPGAINTLAFSLTFTGYTESLREFLNDMSKPDLPIVVRSIEVTRATGKSTRVEAPAQNNLDSIFGAFGGGTEAAEAAPEETKKLVISENTSIFTVVLEFIEIVLPAESAEDNV